MASKYARVIQAMISAQWAILPETLQGMVDVVEREGLKGVVDMLGNGELPTEMVAAKTGKLMKDTQETTIRGGVAIIPVTGPIYRYADWFTDACGGVTIDALGLDFNTALANPEIKAILFLIDSPGGEAKGVAELANMIFAARGLKPIMAYVGGNGASAAYWIASAADEIVISDTGVVGSIGVVTTVRTSQQTNTMEIVSTQSPHKRPDVTTEEGKAKVQGYVDSLAEVFVAAVARNRGVSEETVLADFGQGDIMVGQKAVNAGLADRVGSFESALAELSTNPGRKSTGSQKTSMQSTNGGHKTDMTTIETLKKDHPELAQALMNEGFEKGKADGHAAGKAEGLTEGKELGKKEGAEAELNRIKNVEAALLPGHEALIQTLKFDGKTSGEQASMQIVAAEKAVRTTVLSNLSADAPKPLPQANTDPLQPTAAQEETGLSLEEKCKKKWDASADLQKEFGGVFTRYHLQEKYSAEGRVFAKNK